MLANTGARREKIFKVPLYVQNLPLEKFWQKRLRLLSRPLLSIVPQVRISNSRAASRPWSVFKRNLAIQHGWSLSFGSSTKTTKYFAETMPTDGRRQPSVLTSILLLIIKTASTTIYLFCHRRRRNETYECRRNKRSN